jgi:hypothetical protein
MKKNLIMKLGKKAYCLHLFWEVHLLLAGHLV